MYDEDDFLMISGIQHFVFCRRQWALIHIEFLWSENERTIDGDIKHERAHDPFLSEKRGDIIITRDMPVFSHRLGISGKCDVVEFKKDENGVPLVWGAMNDVGESNKRWGETGKYMAGCEAELDAQTPTGWAKWIIPAQTYLVAECTSDKYGEIFGSVTNDPSIEIVGTVHERYPQPGNPNVLELWFPVAAGEK